MTGESKKRSHYYLSGPAVDRLKEYEDLGYSPEQLKKIIDQWRYYRILSNCHYGKSAYNYTDTDSIRIFDPKDISTWYPRTMFIQVARGNGKSLTEFKELIDLLESGHVILPAGGKSWAAQKLNEFKIRNCKSLPKIERVLFNDPATIVFWKDGTKTVVKADNEEFDPEKGLAMAISKKALGNTRDYYNVFEKHTKKYKKDNK